MHRPTLLATTALAFLACAAPRGSAPSSSASPSSGAKVADAQSSKPRLICRTERPIGSNIPQRICYTQEQLDDMSQAAQDAHRRAVQNAGPTRSGNP